MRAAGCVLWRRAEAGGIEFALVHRPKHGDWSHPKGKLQRDEAPVAAARREVREETGAEIVLGRRLTTQRYLAQGRPKEVDYWAAEAVSGEFVPNDEIDRMLWLPPAEARGTLSHPANRALLDEALATLDGALSRPGAASVPGVSGGGRSGGGSSVQGRGRGA
ncbi:NUDIX hydrolase [Streptomyces marincola]|nr:NUDIX hydrolase [Streptomyces marincola]UCM91807.1 NUDIX hydrolase [Streptomyces marincola]